MLRRLSLAVLLLAAAAVTACSNPTGPSQDVPNKVSPNGTPVPCSVTNGSSICK